MPFFRVLRMRLDRLPITAPPPIMRNRLPFLAFAPGTEAFVRARFVFSAHFSAESV